MDDVKFSLGLDRIREITERALLGELSIDAFWDESAALLSIVDSTHFIKVNPAWTKVLGWTEKELTETPFLEFIHPDDLKPSVEAVESFNKTGNFHQYFINRYRSKSGDYVVLLWMGEMMAHDEKTGNNYSYAACIPLPDFYEITNLATKTTYRTER